jgi:hypothetical protein
VIEPFDQGSHSGDRPFHTSAQEFNQRCVDDDLPFEKKFHQNGPQQRIIGTFESHKRR